MKTYVCNVNVYDLFLKLKWQRCVQLKINIKPEKLSIIETAKKIDSIKNNAHENAKKNINN